MPAHPVVYSFRRCPYAMRARLALSVSGVRVELREILLRKKPPAFLDASPSATVPCLVTGDGVIDESLDIMIWALRQNDPEAWLEMPLEGWDWIAEADGPFKDALDRTKYATRYPGTDADAERAKAAAFLTRLDAAMGDSLFDTPSLADHAIFPFVRQFAFTDKAWFDARDWPRLQRWLERQLASGRFAGIMEKLPPWQEGEAPLWFP